MELETLTLEPTFERTVLFARMATLADWPSDRPEGLGERFVGFVALDARRISHAELLEFAAKLMEHGLAYLVAWGRDCERVHDTFDEVSIARDDFVMTTWHDDEPLDEAAYFALVDAWDEEREHDTILAITAGDEALAEELRRLLCDPSRLIRDVLAREGRG